jgi:NAD(P)-dependent dehydrogenase (short-subunit alcohol dehydrogenase family)
MEIEALAGLLKDDVAVVTGAGQGAGRRMAQGLAAAGASVAVLDIDEKEVAETARLIVGAGGRAVSRRVDVTDAAACEAAAGWSQDALGAASILVNNAGVFIRTPLDGADFREAWNTTQRVNVDGCVNMVMSFKAQLRRTRGRIVNLGSVGSFVAARSAAAYVSSKGAVLQLTRALAAELGPDGIRVNGIAPGRMVTRMTDSYRDDPASKAAYFARTPLGRYAETEDLVGPLLFLVSPMSAYVTGVMLPVDGGFLAV